VLRASVHSGQVNRNSNTYHHVNRRKPRNEVHSAGLEPDPEPEPEPERDVDTLSQVSLGGSLADTQWSVQSAMSPISTHNTHNTHISNISTKSRASTAGHTGSGSARLKPLRSGATGQQVQQSLVDASLSLSGSGAKFGATGSMPLAPAQSHLLLTRQRGDAAFSSPGAKKLNKGVHF
jgi:hypothetical protein